MGGLGRSDIVSVDRCLICYSETTSSLEPEILNGAGVDGVDVSPTDLETVFTLLIRLTLRFCDRCKEAVTTAKSDHAEILDASSMIFKSLKKEITEVVKKYKGVMPREPGQIPEKDTEVLLNNATDNHEHEHDRVQDKEIKKAIPENDKVLTLSINSDKLLENESDAQPSSQENQSNATQTQMDEAELKLIDIDSKEDKNPEKSNENSSGFEERSLLVSTKEMKSNEINLPNSAVSAFDSPLQTESLVNTEKPASLLAQAQPMGVSQNGTDKEIDNDNPPGTLSAKEEQKLLTESTLNKTENSHTQINQVVNAENAKLLSPKKEEENNFVGAKSSADNEEKISAANSAVRKPTNTIQLNIPRFPVIKQTKKAAEEETPAIKSGGEIGTFTIPKFSIISNGVKKTEKKDKGICSNSTNKIQSNSSKDEKVLSAPSPPPPDLKITNSFSLSSIPPISDAVSDERFNCSKSTTINSRPQKTPSTPPTVEHPSSSFADLDPFLEELLNLPQTLKRKRALPQSTLNESHGKRGKILGENGSMYHLCLCGKSYTTNSKVNRHINQMKRNESLISSPNSTNSTIQKAMNEMSCLQQQLEEREDSKRQKGPYLLKTTTVANKILQRYSPRKRTLVLQSSPPKNKYNCSNNSFFETVVAANNMEKVPDSQQSASRPGLPQMSAKRPPFPGFHENKRQSSIRAPVIHHRQAGPLPSSAYQQFAFTAKPRPTFPQRIAKQRLAFRSLAMSKPSGIRSATTHTQLPLLQSSAPSAKKWYHCGQCLNAEEGGVVKRFWSIVELTNHIHSVHGAWKCRMVNCDKRFSTHAALQNHVLKQQCNSMEAFATSKARVLTTAPISIPKINKVSKVPPLIPLPQSSKKVHKPKRKDEDIICIELDD